MIAQGLHKEDFKASQLLICKNIQDRSKCCHNTLFYSECWYRLEELPMYLWYKLIYPGPFGMIFKRELLTDPHCYNACALILKNVMKEIL